MTSTKYRARSRTTKLRTPTWTTPSKWSQKSTTKRQKSQNQSQKSNRMSNTQTNSQNASPGERHLSIWLVQMKIRTNTTLLRQTRAGARPNWNKIQINLPVRAIRRRRRWNRNSYLMKERFQTWTTTANTTKSRKRRPRIPKTKLMMWMYETRRTTSIYLWIISRSLAPSPHPITICIRHLTTSRSRIILTGSGNLRCRSRPKGRVLRSSTKVHRRRSSTRKPLKMRMMSTTSTNMQ